LPNTLTRGDTLPRVTDNATCHIKDLTRVNFFFKKIQKNKNKKKIKKIKKSRG